MTAKRLCAICGGRVFPASEEVLTAHEFNCFKRQPELVPASLKQTFQNTLAWERRSLTAKAAARKRKAKALRKQRRAK